ncbi:MULTISPECIES: SufD family Fe-S cluster assembly protein [Acidiplasma]|jgi:Fe-S cluster assembly protein SufD|uniref:ABC transporter ATP-binding protein n=2 Tax=Acidiplasma TaxID=507753 RepID=A0A0Q0RGH7_9ARCH|nr:MULTISPECIES: SufD family Fe-S cluster assembly protein [Acidiplasma]KJE49650.1 ABC transporter ATP-binding protein [Acidiplasma sp. MBA-1]KPV46247.1 ABC transporter ATP-binding protein [Acidiplasma aeolicum]KQB34222.1 ABC transporter ATP-binding protein [Acidiplasma cupricumulans]KQB36692.1 ABC transporter ATP-binding protein [Acidiplasma aeolicum]WMT55790.1 MAG: SufD family Fe-S cluster assembly protein [Acidiplasma sp.]
MIEDYLDTLNERFRDFDIEYRKQAYIYYLKYPDPPYKESPDRKTYVHIADEELDKMAHGEMYVGIKKSKNPDINYDIIVNDSEIILNNKDKNIYTSNMKNAFKERHDLFEKYVDTVYGKYNKENLINFSYENGYFVYIPDNTSAEIKIKSEQDANSSFTVKNVVIIGKNSKASIVDLYESEDDGSGIHGRNIYIFCLENSKVDYNYIQNESLNSANITYVRPVLYNDAQLKIIDVNTGSGRVIYNHESEMHDNTTLNSYGINITRGIQEHDIWDSSLQYGKFSNCDINIKGIVFDQSSTMHRGNIDIEPDGVKSTGFYNSAILLMSENGKGNSKPALLIKNNDTKSKHASVISSIDPEQVFYLRSRGISENDAISLIVQGFLGYINDHVDNEFAKNIISKIININ